MPAFARNACCDNKISGNKKRGRERGKKKCVPTCASEGCLMFPLGAERGTFQALIHAVLCSSSCGCSQLLSAVSFRTIFSLNVTRPTADFFFCGSLKRSALSSFANSLSLTLLISRSCTTHDCLFSQFKAKRRRAWHKQCTGVSRRQNQQHHVKQTMIFSPTYDVQRGAYQHRGNKLVVCKSVSMRMCGRDKSAHKSQSEMLCTSFVVLL
jgi:hypothetical protein